jgi:hypothetical protein
MSGRTFSWAAERGARLLFILSVVTLLAGIANFISAMTADHFNFATAEHIFLVCFTPPACLLFAAVVAHRLARFGAR